jgi:hypothetical protein
MSPDQLDQANEENIKFKNIFASEQQFDQPEVYKSCPNTSSRRDDIMESFFHKPFSENDATDSLSFDEIFDSCVPTYQEVLQEDKKPYLGKL